MQCDAPENSFSLIGGGWTLVLSDFQNPGILWGDLAVIWEKGGPHKEYLGIDYTFMSQSYSFTDYLTVSSYLGVTLLPMTLWASQVIKLFLPLPFATGCNDFWKDKGFSGLYVTPPWNLAALKSPGFDDASWPRSMDPEDLIVDSLAFRIRVQPRLKVLPGGGASVWPRRRRSYGLVVVVVVVGVGLGLGVRKTGRSSKKDCNRTSMVGGASGLSPGDCLFPCQVASHFLSNSSDSEGSPSISYQVDRLPGVDLAAPGELSELEWFAESPEWPENLTLPAGFLFDSPDLRNLLSTAERQRVQGFKEGSCGFRAGQDNAARRKRCEVGTLIGGACSKLLPLWPHGGADYLAAFPEDQNMFRCLGTGEWSDKPVHETVASAWCLELEGNEKVIMVRREGRDSASVQCPDGYQVVGGGCTFIEGTEFALRESYPTSRNTWECVFDSTQSCGEGSPVCLRSEARAMCLGIASAQ
ncbi:unnamed protein product [Symbiodinium sp. KB8]|nr:unnamed protein product [Symbiodinium sp. KB8]